jgi:protein TonB
MNRLQKKCLSFSLGLHGLVVLVLLAGPAFRNRPQPSDLQIMTVIPARILDRAGAGGGSPLVTVNQPPPAPPVPVQPQPQPQRPMVSTPPVEPPRRPTLPQREEVEPPAPEPRPSEDLSLEPKEKPRKPRHEVHTDYTPASKAKTSSKTEKDQSREKQAREKQAREATERAEAQRLREIQESLGQLAKGVKSSGARNTAVDVAGIGGGEAFASYRNVIFNAYYHAWKTPDSLSDRTAEADAKVTIARDGTILSAAIVRPSGNGALDRSVERALAVVTKLPPFPDSARDQEQTFTIEFSPSLENK